MRYGVILALMFAVQAPSDRPAADSEFSLSSASVRHWANRVTAQDPKVRSIAQAALVQGAPRSLPLLKRLLDRSNEDVQVVTLEVIRRIGPPALPLLVDLLQDARLTIRRNAIDAL